MFLRGSIVVVAVLALAFAACSGPEAQPSEVATSEPPVTSTATAEPPPTATATPPPTPTPKPTPTPTPACDIGEVAALLYAFIDAFNTGDWERLRQVLPLASAASAPVDPITGSDTSQFHGSVFTYEMRGEVPLSFESPTGDALIAHLQERHALGEQWTANIAGVQPFGNDPRWATAEAAEITVDMVRDVDGPVERAAHGLAVVHCRNETIAFWQMSDDPLPPVEILSLALNDIDGEPLRFLSADEHPYFDGYTLVHGALQVAGDTALADVTLEVIEDDAVVATGELVTTASDLLIGPFVDGFREVSDVQPLFRIDSTQFQEVDRDIDGLLSLRVRVVTEEGDQSTVELADPVVKLVLYWGENRYLLDEEDRGGNDWVQASVRDIVAGWDDVLLGDFSDMNGGPYPPHVSHQEGLDVDVWFFGYNEMDDDTAQTLLAYIDGKPYTSRIVLVYAAYEPVEGDPFFDAIAGYTLSDGRPATDVIIADDGHTGHFHVRFASIIDD